jgi:uncharacterized membrane protein YagU involved in acid resistance
MLGQQAFQGGITMAALGLVIHFFIAFVVVTIFYLISGKLPFLTEHAMAAGLLYGVGVYLFMYWIVLPHVFPKFRHSFSNDALAMLIHICLIGLPTALVMRAKSKGRL